jgi:penicillin-binding protein 2
MNPGILFGESIKTEKIKRHRHDDDRPSSRFRSRSFLFFITIILVGMVLIVKLFSLQVFEGKKYRLLADSNRIRTQIIHAPRGIIFDRSGEPLVFNTPGFLRISKEKDGVIKTEHITKEEALDLLTKGDKNIGVTSLRQYPLKDTTSHVLGYIGQISKDELESTEFIGYQANDWIGKEGIEGEYEQVLHGQDGHQLIEVDAMGKKVRELGQSDPIPGKDITLTLDAKLQRKVHDAAKSIQKGSIIVSTPDGEILSMISMPSYDANLFTLDKTYKASSAYSSLQDVLLDSGNQPLLNRAIGGVYPPGSTFKIVTAAAGLEGVINDNYRVEDTGILKVGDFSYANWYYTDYGRKEQGSLDIIRALARSNDIFFYKLAEKVNVDRLSTMGKKFGLGEVTGIDLGGEVGGLIPTKDWKKKQIKEDWYLGDTFHYGIGQGYLLTTPLQVNVLTQVIANGGSLYEPHLLSQKSKVKSQKFLTDKTVDLIRHGMIDACSKGGVAYPLFDFKVKTDGLQKKMGKSFKIDGKNFMDAPSSGSAKMTKIAVACKTGTAQHGGEDTLPHAWITLFAPAYKPEVVVTVLVEAGGGGSDVAAPIAKKVLEAYFSK